MVNGTIVDVEDGDDECVYALTPWGCMMSILNEYNIQHDHITPRIGEHMVEDFMNLMEKQGIVKKNVEANNDTD